MGKLNTLRIDPTRTLTLRRAFGAKVRAAFGRFASDVQRLVGDEDVFGLSPAPSGNPSDLLAANAGRWAFRPVAEKLKLFGDWLRLRLGELVLGKTQEQLWKEYVEAGYKKALGRTFDELSKAAKAGDAPDLTEQLDFSLQTREQFLRSAFFQPVSVEKVQLVASRTFSELKGVTEQMSTAMVRTLADGLVTGVSPRTMARTLAAQVEGLGTDRALTVARTEIIRAHAEGQLTAMEMMGVEEVGAMVEWETTHDLKVCKKCAPLLGVVLKINEARGMLPRHPNCRCAWVPANVGESPLGQKRAKRVIDAAVKKSLAGSGDDWGPATSISPTRPAANADTAAEFAARLPIPADPAALGALLTAVGNVFCATGPGGGIDPHCSPGSGGAGGGHVEYPAGWKGAGKGGDNSPNPAVPDAARPKLSLTEANALRDYSDVHAYGPLNNVNNALRADAPVPGRSFAGRLTGAPNLAAIHAGLTAAFDKAAPLKPPVKVERGITVDDPAAFAGFFKDRSGTPNLVVLPGYQSTSTKAGYGGNVKFTIHATHGLDAKPYSRAPGENELLLPHASRYAVGKVEQRGSDWHIELHQVPPDRSKT